LVVSCGLAFTWQRWGPTGLTPLVIYLTYVCATSFATTSGGRYLVPVDWVYYFYYVVGMVQILKGFSPQTRMEKQSATLENNQKSYPVLLSSVTVFFLAIGLMIAIGMTGFKPRYPTLTQDEIIKTLLLKQTGLDQQTLLPLIKAVQLGRLNLVYGRMLYPIYLDYQNDRSIEVDTAIWKENKPALIFDILGNNKNYIAGRLILDQPPESIPPAADAIVFTCPDRTAQVLIIYHNDTPTLLTSTDGPTFSCDS
jgi:hypothetical protein